jgi:hypothetical protein
LIIRRLYAGYTPGFTKKGFYLSKLKGQKGQKIDKKKGLYPRISKEKTINDR